MTPRDEPSAFEQLIERQNVDAAILAPKQLKGVAHHIRSSCVLRLRELIARSDNENGSCVSGARGQRLRTRPVIVLATLGER